MDTKQIGLYLKKQRNDKGISQKELGELLGVTHQAISRWENGTSLPDLIMVEKLATLYSVTIDQILQRDNKINKDNNLSKFIMISSFSILAMVIGLLLYGHFYEEYYYNYLGIICGVLGIVSANIVVLTTYFTKFKSVASTKIFFNIFCVIDLLCIIIFIILLSEL